MSVLLQEIVAVSTVGKKEIGRCFKQILKVLETTVEVVTTSDYMFRFCSNLDISNKVSLHYKMNTLLDYGSVQIWIF